MRRLAALTGAALATGMALFAAGDRPEDLVARYYSSTTHVAPEAIWHDWHPEATHSITLKWGTGQPDDRYSYAVADWEALPDWQEDPELAEALAGYVETDRSVPEISSGRSDDGSILVTAVTRVDYTWFGYAGLMTQTDRFHVITNLGVLAIRSLDTTYDYR